MTLGVCCFPSLSLHLTVTVSLALYIIKRGCPTPVPTKMPSLLQMLPSHHLPRPPVPDSVSAQTPDINAAKTLRPQSPLKQLVFKKWKTNFLYLFIMHVHGAWARESLERQAPRMLKTPSPPQHQPTTEPSCLQLPCLSLGCGLS